MRRMARGFCLFALCVLVAAAQQPPANVTPAQAPPQAAGTIRVGTKVVVEEVTAKDKSGKTIEGLTPNDFNITEDGVPQTVSFVEFQHIEAAVNTAGPTPSPGAAIDNPA